MIVSLLGFGGRMGRLTYFFYSLALAALTTAAVMAVIFTSLSHAAPGAEPDSMPAGVIATCVFIVGPLFLWASTALMAKRLRDIGWPPLPVILGWLAVSLVDAAVGAVIPAVEASHGGTALGGCLNLALYAALLFWPGNGESDFVFVEQGSRWRPPEIPQAIPVPNAPPATRGFGRRGL